jgi:hypothetical protein
MKSEAMWGGAEEDLLDQRRRVASGQQANKPTTEQHMV